MGKKNIIKDSIRAGACDFIVKPFKERRMIETVRKHIKFAKRNLDYRNGSMSESHTYVYENIDVMFF